MKIGSLIFFSLILVSCVQNPSKENAKIDSSSKPLTIDTIEITDLTKFEYYGIAIDSAYFYARADSNTKMTTYLTKDDLTVICEKKGEFGYAVERTDSVIRPLGWIKLKYLTKIFFTPPKVIKD